MSRVEDVAEFAEQLPPHDAEAEEACIAAMMVDHEACFEITSTGLLPDHFFREKNGWTYAACLAIWDRGESVNQVTVAHELATMGRLEDVGGLTYLGDVIRRLATSIRAEFYAEIVKRDATYRGLIRAAAGILHKAYSAPADLDDMLDEADDMLRSARGATQFRRSTTPAEITDELLERTVMWLEDTSIFRGITTGWPELDFLIDGFTPGSLVIAGAATSIGKSLFCHNVVRSLCSQGIPVTLWTTEMDAYAAQERLAWMEAGIDRQVVKKRGSATTGERNRIFDAYERVRSWPVRFATAANPSIGTIRAEARRDRHVRNCYVQLVDHLGKVRAPGKTTIERTAAVSDGLAGIASDEGITVLATSQVTRDSQKVPRWLGPIDLANASNVEQDATQVILLTPITWEGNSMVPIADTAAREAMSLDGGVAINVQVAKNRIGATGSAPTFVDWAHGGRIQGFSGANAP